MMQYRLELQARQANIANLRLILEFDPADKETLEELKKLVRTAGPVLPKKPIEAVEDKDNNISTQVTQADGA